MSYFGSQTTNGMDFLDPNYYDALLHVQGQKLIKEYQKISSSFTAITSNMIERALSSQNELYSQGFQSGQDFDFSSNSGGSQVALNGQAQQSTQSQTQTCDSFCQSDYIAHRQRMSLLFPPPSRQTLYERQLQKQREASYSIDLGKQPIIDVMQVIESAHYERQKKEDVWLSEFEDRKKTKQLQENLRQKNMNSNSKSSAIAKGQQNVHADEKEKQVQDLMNKRKSLNPQPKVLNEKKKRLQK